MTELFGQSSPLPMGDGYIPGAWDKIRSLAADGYITDEEYTVLHRAVHGELLNRIAHELPLLREKKHSGSMMPHASASDCRKCITDSVLNKLEAVLDGCTRAVVEEHGSWVRRCGDHGLHDDTNCPLAEGGKEEEKS